MSLNLLTFLVELGEEVGLELYVEEIDEGLLGGFKPLDTKALVGYSISTIISSFKTDFIFSIWPFL